MSVRNGEAFLRACVESILGQTLSDLELVIVDDASTDATPELLEEFDDPRIVRVRNEEAVGVAGSLNRALSLCRGALIARMDADAVCEPRRLERQVALLDARPALAGCGTMRVEINDAGEVVERPDGCGEPGFLNWWMCLGNPIRPTSCVVRREMIDSLGRYGEAAPHASDYDLFSHIFRSGRRMEILSERLVRCRCGETEATRADATRQQEDSERVRREHIVSLIGHRPQETASVLMRQVLSWRETPDPQALLANHRPMLELMGQIRTAAIVGASETAVRAIDAYATEHLLRRADHCLATVPRVSLAMGRYVARLPGMRKPGRTMADRAWRCRVGRLRRRYFPVEVPADA